MKYAEFLKYVEHFCESYRDKDYDISSGFDETFSILEDYDNYFGNNKEKHVENVIYTKIKTGGVSGGSCWDDSDPQPFSNDYDDTFTIFEQFIENALFAKKIAYTDYKKLTRLVKSFNRCETEYYGNYRDYLVKYIEVKDLYDFLKENDIL